MIRMMSTDTRIAVMYRIHGLLFLVSLISCDTLGQMALPQADEGLLHPFRCEPVECTEWLAIGDPQKPPHRQSSRAGMW